MITKLIAPIVVSLFLFSCNNTVTEKPQTQVETDTLHAHQQDVNHQNIELLNGEKWEINAEMIPPLSAMEMEVKTYLSSGQKDYKSLAAALQKNLDSVVSSCTMKGQSHEELHKWLVPLMTSVAKLSEAKNEDEAVQYIQDIQGSFNTFYQYFKHPK